MIALSHIFSNSPNKWLEIKLLGLKGAANKNVKAYSLGMRQRLGIAQALLNAAYISDAA